MTSRFLVDPSGGSTSTDPALASKVKQAYSDVTVSGSQLTFSTVGGDSKSVSVTGGAGTSVTAFNGATLDTATNEVTFSSTTGASADEVLLDLDPMLTPLESTVGGHTTDIATLNTTVSGHTTDIATNASDISTLNTTVSGHTNDITNIKNLTGTSTLKTTVDDTLKSIEIDTNGDLRGKRHDNSYTGKVEHLNDAFISAAIDANGDLTFGQISGNTTAGITLPTGTGTGVSPEFTKLSQHPDLTEAQITADSVTVNGRTYVFDQSSYAASDSKGRHAFYDEWETENVADHTYTTHVSGLYYDYSGTSSIDGIAGEWISIQFPEPIIVNSFEMSRASNTKSAPHKFSLLCSNNGTSWNNLKCYDEDNELTSDDGDYLSLHGSTFNADVDDSQYGEAFTHWAIVVTQIREGSLGNKNFAIEDLKFFSVSKDEAQRIKRNFTTFNEASITESGGTYYLNLERNDPHSTTNVQLTLPTGGTASGYNPAAIEDVTYGKTSTANAKPYIETTTQGNTTTEVELFDGFVSAVKDGDNIKLTTEAGNDVTVGPFSGSGGATSTTNYPTSALTSNGGFSVTPPATITLTGGWGASGYNLTRISYTTTSVIYNLYNPSTNLQFGGYGIVITIVSDQLRLYVNDSTHGPSEPTSFTINGNAASEGDVVTGNDTIALILTSPPGVTDTFTVPTELTPSTITASASSNYNLFTDKLFGSDNLGNLGEYVLNTTNSYPVKHWGLDQRDGNVIIHASSGSYSRFVKITQEGITVVTNAETGRYYTSNQEYSTLQDLLAGYDAATISTVNQTFNKHALFDLAVNNSPAYYAFDEVATTEWVSHSNTYKPSTTVIDFSAYIDKTVEYAQEDLNHHYGFLQPQFMCENPRQQATSSNSEFEHQKGSYTANPGGINFWHAGTTNLSLFRVVADADGTMEVKYGNLWTGNSVGLEHTSGGTTTNYSTGAVETTQTLTVSKGDIIEIVETLGVIALYSISFTRSTEVGEPVAACFSGTPPSTISLTGGWGGSGYSYQRTSYTSTSAMYDLSIGSNYAIVFSINANNELTLDVNDSTHGSWDPASFTINGGTASNPGVISANDTIDLLNSSGGVAATFSVPNEFAVFGSSKLATTTDAGEYIKIALDSAVEAETLTLKSVSEYKEPRINMTNYSQCGYEVTASSENSATSPVYLAFNNLTTPDTDKWISGSNVYDATSGNYSGSNRLSDSQPIDSDGALIPYGEYLMITFPDKRKLIGYTLTAQASGTAGTPKQFILYAQETSTSLWVNLNSQSLTTALGSYVSGDLNTGGTRFDLSNPTTTAYQSFALVITHNFPAHLVHLNEFKLHCQPSEIEEFKLYASPDNSSWTEILHQSTSANVTSSGTEFTITNHGSYQYYGLVVTKNGGYHNVSLAEMKLATSGAVDLSNYYNKSEVDTELSNYYTQPQVNALLPKGVRAEGTFSYQGNGTSTWSAGGVTFFANSSNVAFAGASHVAHMITTYGNISLWSNAPDCTHLRYRFDFSPPIVDELGEETNEYKVFLQKASHHITHIYSLEVYVKTSAYFEVVIEIDRDATTNNIHAHEFDFVVF